MTNNLYYNTVPPLLLEVLKTLMTAKEFADFRLVGGTALSLYKGHRESVDIDLFTDAPYDSIDFDAIDVFLRSNYPYVDTNDYNVIGFGKSYYVGESDTNCIKLDIFYADEFIDNQVIIDDIRLASIEEIIAMKLDVISRGGRKKDFWDIHELIDDYSIEEMLLLHEKRYPHAHDQITLRNKFTHFEDADIDFEPVCLKGKHWELIKLDIVDFIKNI
jgi:hypothetical protein